MNFEEEDTVIKRTVQTERERRSDAISRVCMLLGDFSGDRDDR